MSYVCVEHTQDNRPILNLCTIRCSDQSALIICRVALWSSVYRSYVEPAHSLIACRINHFLVVYRINRSLITFRISVALWSPVRPVHSLIACRINHFLVIYRINRTLITCRTNHSLIIHRINRILIICRIPVALFWSQSVAYLVHKPSNYILFHSNVVTSCCRP